MSRLMLLAGDALALTFISAYIGFANGMSSGTMMTIGADFAPPDMRSEFLSVWRLIGDLGFVGGSIVVGAVAQALVIPDIYTGDLQAPDLVQRHSSPYLYRKRLNGKRRKKKHHQ